MWCEGVLCVGVYEVWECIGCGNVCDVGVYVVWECICYGSLFSEVKNKLFW